MSGLRNWFIKRANPDAVIVDDLGGQMEAYYDKERKVWVFPGEDPADVAAPLAPPPKTPMASSSAPAVAEDPKPNNDPLAAMMAPPRRGPSAKPKSGVAPSPKSMPVMFPPGTMSPAVNGSAAPKFAVFKPKPDDGKKENKEPKETES